MDFLKGILPGEPSLHLRRNGERSKNGKGYPTVDQQLVIDDENAYTHSNGTTSPTRTEAERSLLHTLSAEHGTERRDKVLLLEQYLRNHGQYLKLFHDNPERSTITDDETLSLDLLVVHKFLISKKFNYKAAQKSITDWIDWRLKEKPHKITLDEVWEEYVTGKAYWRGHDMNGLPVCILRPNFHDPTQRDWEQCRRFAIWVAEEGSRLMQQCGKSRCVVIYDASKVSVKNFDLSMFQVIIDIFNMYPEILEYAFVIPTFAFWALWKLGSSLLDKRTKKKIQFVDSLGDLLKRIDSDELERVFSGTSSFDFFEHVEEMSREKESSPSTAGSFVNIE